MEHLLSLFVRSIFVDNMIFAFFLGMCSYLAVSKTVKTALGLGVAVTFVLLVTVPIDYLLQTEVLSPEGSLNPGVDLTFFSLPSLQASSSWSRWWWSAFPHLSMPHSVSSSLYLL